MPSVFRPIEFADRTETGDHRYALGQPRAVEWGMCNRYDPMRADIILVQWELGEPVTGDKTWRPGIGPLGQRTVHSDPAGRARTDRRSMGLIGDKGRKPNNAPRMTNCARSEELEQTKTFAGPWRRGQRCPIPAERFDYPDWETKKNVWWTLRRADGKPWHLTGVKNTWTDLRTGKVFESHCTLTQNCDEHPLWGRFHKTELGPHGLPFAGQDKRTVVPLEAADFRTWLTVTIEDAKALIRIPPAELCNSSQTYLWRHHSRTRSLAIRLRYSEKFPAASDQADDLRTPAVSRSHTRLTVARRAE